MMKSEDSGATRTMTVGNVSKSSAPQFPHLYNGHKKGCPSPRMVVRSKCNTLGKALREMPAYGERSVNVSLHDYITTIIIIVVIVIIIRVNEGICQ